MKLSPISYFASVQNNYAKAKLTNFSQNNKPIAFGQEHDFFERALDNESKKTQPQNGLNNASSHANRGTVLSISKASSGFDSTLEEVLTTAGVVGVPFLLLVTLTDAVSKTIPSNEENLYTQDGYYVGNINDFSVDPSDVNADITKGTIKIKGTGINIDKSRYDSELSIPEKGIFKSADGSLDIDLANNKYIDKENGIIVDPVAKISAFTTADGSLLQLPLQNFGSAYPTRSEDVRWQSYRPATESEDITRLVIEEYVKDNNISDDAANGIIKFANDVRLKEYLIDHYPDLTDKVNVGSVDQFIQNLHESNVDYETASGLIDIVNDASNQDFA